jgi:hypothetical protein
LVQATASRTGPSRTGARKLGFNHIKGGGRHADLSEEANAGTSAEADGAAPADEQKSLVGCASLGSGP